ncbi:acylphosphatase [Acinetobacter pecorum]|uniref:acylphosphatase n=1 Tax=Acinetobacter pecorum TaxID=2762215 RepID=A0ABR8W0B3_9GAMM|nr:acylphosphatase [Acinetobacter pecorum]MBD8010452.1 acylphosphatase [Acinetobacter pecorum]
MPVIKLNISGQVQGVGYRYWFAEQAQQLGLKGYVKNLSIGGVEAVIAGTDSQLQEMITRSWQGPACANVQAVIQEHLESDLDAQDFRILR